MSRHMAVDKLFRDHVATVDKLKTDYPAAAEDLKNGASLVETIRDHPEAAALIDELEQQRLKLRNLL